jgi:hypothetical protein
VAEIAWLISHTAQRFASGQEHNAYKHGLRVVAGSAGLGVAIQPATSESKHVLSMKHAVTYLELSEDRDGYVGQCVTKEVGPEYSFELINCMALVLLATKEMRVARTKQHVDTASFPQIDREVLLKLQPQSCFSLPF